ncbi:MAG: hypothetical protein WCV85_00645 [Patescibacteria group bacterium]|jgi:hypothetical protein
MNILKILFAAMTPRPNVHTTRIGDYTFSYRKQVMGPLFTFTIENAVSEAEARMRAQVKIKKLSETEGAIDGSQQLVLD